jgi:hypothetical protein
MRTFLKFSWLYKLDSLIDFHSISNPKSSYNGFRTPIIALPNYRS